MRRQLMRCVCGGKYGMCTFSRFTRRSFALTTRMTLGGDGGGVGGDGGDVRDDGGDGGVGSVGGDGGDGGSSGEGDGGSKL